MAVGGFGACWLLRETLSASTSSGQLQLVWPQDHTGWILQAQTNPPNTGLGTNWVTVPASSGTNQMAFPTDPTTGSVFFRLYLSQ
ncbi:MAG TPA: hypothetical protein VN281_09930 [Verrucomicrobiae bacterium]|nr:hypothetical protein [Verrucomicrobiae bacterium]